MLPCHSRDKAYVPGAKPKAELEALDKELLELVAELQPTPEERQRQQVRRTGLLTCAACTTEGDSCLPAHLGTPQPRRSAWVPMQRTLSSA